MQSSKSSKKTSKTPESAAPFTSENAAKPRANKSSSSSKSKIVASNSEGAERKSSMPAPIPAAATHSDNPKPILSDPAFAAEAVTAEHGHVQHEDIARLAYSLWAARGYQPGSPEEDWLRAESQLRTLAAAQ